MTQNRDGASLLPQIGIVPDLEKTEPSADAPASEAPSQTPVPKKYTPAAPPLHLATPQPAATPPIHADRTAPPPAPRQQRRSQPQMPARARPRILLRIVHQIRPHRVQLHIPQRHPQMPLTQRAGVKAALPQVPAHLRPQRIDPQRVLPSSARSPKANESRRRGIAIK